MTIGIPRRRSAAFSSLAMGAVPPVGLDVVTDREGRIGWIDARAEPIPIAIALALARPRHVIVATRWVLRSLRAEEDELGARVAAGEFGTGTASAADRLARLRRATDRLAGELWEVTADECHRAAA